MKKQSNKIYGSVLAVLIFFTGFFAAYQNGYCDIRDDRDSLSDALKDASDEDSIKIQAEINMYDRQIAVSDSLDNIKQRVDSVGSTDTRKKSADDAYGAADKAVSAFKNLKPDSSYDPDKQRSNEEFNKLEKEALNALNAVNQALIAPERPGNVYEGDITQDFIPGLIKFAFRLASLAVFAAFVVSGVLFVIAFGEEARVTKAKNILYYTLIGFVFIVLAYAIVKALTDVNYFGLV